METAQRVGRGIAIALGVIAIVAAAVWFVVDYYQDRAAQKADYRDDLIAVGFKSPNPDWEDETKHGKTVSALEAVIQVAGCDVELERADDEEVVAGKVENRDIQAYTVDEVNHGGDEIEIDDLHNQAPDPNEIDAFLRQEGKDRFPCLT